jgi:hypothetical protein
MQAVLEAGLLAHGNREDGSPFDFNAAITSALVGVLGAVKKDCGARGARASGPCVNKYSRPKVLASWNV